MALFGESPRTALCRIQIASTREETAEGSKIPGKKGKTFTLYCIECTAPSGDSWTVERRYSEFERLEKDLVACGCQAIQLLTLPGKTRGFGRGTSAKVVAERSGGLCLWLDALCKRYAKERALVEFLKTPAAVEALVEKSNTAVEHTEHKEGAAAPGEVTVKDTGDAAPAGTSLPQPRSPAAVELLKNRKKAIAAAAGPTALDLADDPTAKEAGAVPPPPSPFVDPADPVMAHLAAFKLEARFFAPLQAMLAIGGRVI
jgi:hypothetical protein